MRNLDINEEKQTIHLIEDVLLTHVPSSIPYLIQIIRTTHNNQIRNRVALAFKTLQDPQFVAVLMDLIKSPDITDKGTLIGALIPFNERSILFDLIQVMASGMYEQMIRVIFVIEAFEGDVDSTLVDKSMRFLEALKQTLSLEWQHTMIDYTIALLQETSDVE